MFINPKMEFNHYSSHISLKASEVAAIAVFEGAEGYHVTLFASGSGMNSLYDICTELNDALKTRDDLIALIEAEIQE